ncbi:MAG: macro domain-containing protein [bacterium]
MPFQIIRNDITKVKADAIVNTANPQPVIGSGTDSAIHQAAGQRLLKARKKIGEIAPGEAVSTPAYRLKAKYIIHTVGPVWVDGHHQERDILHNCYKNALQTAASLHCQSIAFPLIATGNYGFPKDEALEIALGEINRFLLNNDMLVILVVFDNAAFTLSKKLVYEIEEYIDEHTVSSIRKNEYITGRNDETRRLEMSYHQSKPVFSNYVYHEAESAKEDERLEEAVEESYEASMPFQLDVAGKSLEDILKNDEDTFQQRLFKLIDESGMDDVTVYKKANIDRKVFSRIRCKPDYKPKKKTAVAFAIALELDLPTMLDLLARAEIAFSPSNKFDLIITYFITNQIYDIYEINAALFKYGQPILGV